MVYAKSPWMWTQGCGERHVFCLGLLLACWSTIHGKLNRKLSTESLRLESGINNKLWCSFRLLWIEMRLQQAGLRPSNKSFKYVSHVYEEMSDQSNRLLFRLSTLHMNLRINGERSSSSLRHLNFTCKSVLSNIWRSLRVCDALLPAIVVHLMPCGCLYDACEYEFSSALLQN